MSEGKVFNPEEWEEVEVEVTYDAIKLDRGVASKDDLKVFIRKNSFDFGRLEVGDVVIWRDRDCPWVITQCPPNSAPENKLYEVVEMRNYQKSWASTETFYRYRDVSIIFRNGKQIYPLTEE